MIWQQVVQAPSEGGHHPENLSLQLATEDLLDNNHSCSNKRLSKYKVDLAAPAFN